MKKETKELLKIIDNTADKHGISRQKVFSQFIEMTYQFCVTGTYKKMYSLLHNEHSSFYKTYLEACKSNPYFDYFNEMKIDMNSYDKKKMAQCMTPQPIVDVIIAITFEAPKKDEKICEFTCGTGGIVLTVLKERIKHKDFDGLQLIANDKDKELAKICIIQVLTNLLVNDVEKMAQVDFICFGNDVLTEYLKNGFVLYDNDMGKIQDKYVVSYYKYKQEQKLQKQLIEKYTAYRNRLFAQTGEAQ